MSQREVRAVAVDDAQVRADDSELRFTGHASVFGQRTWIGPKQGGFWEEVASGFFDDVLEDRAAFLVNHDPNIVLARNGSTMTLSTDERGLVPDAEWDPEDPEARMWARRVKRGDVSEMSFAFTVAEDDWSEADDGNELRVLKRADRLFDVSLVTYPAYDGTDAGMRSAQAAVAAAKASRSTPEPESPQSEAETPEDSVTVEDLPPIDTPNGPTDVHELPAEDESVADDSGERKLSLLERHHRNFAKAHGLSQ